jgi:NADH-quinone oxidoreductase subunit D
VTGVPPPEPQSGEPAEAGSSLGTVPRAIDRTGPVTCPDAGPQPEPAAGSGLAAGTEQPNALAARGRGDLVELTLGPRYPATQGVLRLCLALDGDTIADCRPEIGYGHRGLEKLFEGFSLRDGVALTDRLDFVAAAAANLAYAGAVEKLLGLGVPPRARYLRVVLAELQRVASHLLWLATHAAEAGVEAPFLPWLGDRERVLDLLSEYCGARLTLRCAVPGGLPRDAPPGWLARCGEVAAALPAWVDAYEATLASDRLFRDRTVGLGVLSRETALEYGVTGPVLRATGADWDLRKALPYDAYDELDFEVPLASNGDACDRCRVRVAELRQSARLIAQCLGRLPGGPVLSDLPDAGRALAPAAGAYASVEGPRGEIGFYIALGDGQGQGVATPADALAAPPWRCHVRAPSYFILQALPELVRGHQVADLVVLLGSLDLALGEVDR